MRIKDLITLKETLLIETQILQKYDIKCIPNSKPNFDDDIIKDQKNMF